MFRKIFSLNRIRDSVTFREGKEEITLRVDSDVNGLVMRIRAVEKELMKVNNETPVNERKRIARAFSEAMFGTEQTRKLFDFYKDNEDCVITICGMYFGDRKNGLSRKIAKVQKKRR